MTIKEKVYSKLIELCDGTKEKDFYGITAKEIADILGVQRNVVSHYLNELCREGKVVKTNTRPVYFFDLNSSNKKVEDVKESKEGDPFSKLIGSNGSLKEQVEQCKASALYPNKGLPITITGNSGVGKSFIAKIIYEYAIYKKCIDEDAPFITFNCADYANNPELLSANLFGYKKGAFTGADKDTTGLIEAADNGYLFLDEVHRLSPEGQEKLFLFLDQGKFRRIGETNKWRTAKVRFIFATTEDLDEVLLDTFKRRIPIFVEIPNLNERTIEERLAMIYSFYQKEAKEIDKDLIINKNVINSLLSIRGNGNVGLLKNVIMNSLANSYRLSGASDTININLDSLPGKFKNSNYIKNTCCTENMKVYKNEAIKISNKYTNNLYNESVLNEIKNILKFLNNLNSGIIDYGKFNKVSNRSVNNILNEIIFNNANIEKDILTYELIFNIVNNALIFIQKNYGIKYYGNTTKVLTYAIIFLKSIEEKEISGKSDLKAYMKILKKRFPDSYLVSKKFLEIVEGTLDSKLGNLILLLTTLHINNMANITRNKINGIIVAHGFSTASSIASVANTCFEDFIFEPFDMPIDVTTATVTKKIKEYLNYVDTEKGTLILVDMGSLNEIYDELKSCVNGDVGIINNISTRLALDVASNIINKETVETIVKKCAENNKTEFKYYEAPNKKKAILVTCISGVGTAKKIKEILNKCIGESDLEIIVQDYESVVNGISNNKDLKGYDVKLVISTTAMEIKGVNVIELQNLISGQSDKILEEVLGEVNKKKSIDEIKDDIIKLFSLQNIINQLTILNPNKIIDEVSKIINNYQLALHMNFKSELKLALFIHISALIERLVLRDAIISHPKEKSFVKNHGDFIEESDKIFKDILDEYKVTLPIAEIINIYYIIKIRENDNVVVEDE